MHGLFHEFVSNASSMAPSRFNMKNLARAKLATVDINHDPVKNGPTRGPSFHFVVHRDLRYSRQMQGMFHACVSNASSMAPSRFNMERLAHAKLGTVGIDHDPVKNGPTRGPSFHSVVNRDSQYSRQIHGLFHEFISKSSLMAQIHFSSALLYSASCDSLHVSSRSAIEVMTIRDQVCLSTLLLQY
jgi:hypothetical protein